MKIECRDCGYVGHTGFPPPPPAISLDGSESQPVPACPKCRSGNIKRLR